MAATRLAMNRSSLIFLLALTASGGLTAHAQGERASPTAASSPALPPAASAPAPSPRWRDLRPIRRPVVPASQFRPYHRQKGRGAAPPLLPMTIEVSIPKGPPTDIVAGGELVMPRPSSREPQTGSESAVPGPSGLATLQAPILSDSPPEAGDTQPTPLALPGDPATERWAGVDGPTASWAGRLSNDEIAAMIDSTTVAGGAGRGLFLRAVAGPLLSHASVVTKRGTSSVSGWGLGLGLSAGLWVGPDIVFAGEVSGATVIAPSVDGDGIAHPAADTTFTTLSVGASAIYFVPTVGASLTGGLLLTKVRFVDRSTSRLVSGSNFGPALAFGVAKEWPMAETWGLGAAVRTSIAWPEDMRRSMSLTAFGVWAGLSASYD